MWQALVIFHALAELPAGQLAKEERRAEQKASLTSKHLGDGTTRITINVPDAAAPG